MNPIKASPTPFEFHGAAWEYFKIWIVNLTLSILTLGIYSAWAKVRTKRYFYRNFEIAGSAFEYHARPLQILKGRLIVFGFYVLYLVLSEYAPMAAIALFILFWLGVPWMVMRAHQFNARNSSWRGVHFDFRADVLYDAIKVFLLWPLLLPFSLFLLAPYLSYRGWQFSITNAKLGETSFALNARPSGYYRLAALSFGLFALTWVMFTGLLVILWLLTSGSDGLDLGISELPFWALIPAYLLGFFTYRILSRNLSLNHTTLAGNHFESTLRVADLAKIYTLNTFAILLSAGLLIPWARIRVARYQAEHLFVHAQDLEQFVQSASSDSRALGEEGAEFLDLDLGGI